MRKDRKHFIRLDYPTTRYKSFVFLKDWEREKITNLLRADLKNSRDFIILNKIQILISKLNQRI